MRQTIVHIPPEFAGIPVFGCGWLLIAWACLSIVFFTWLIRRHGWNANTRGHLPVLALMALAIIGLKYIEEKDSLGYVVGLPIRSYGVMVLLGVLSGVWLATHRARRMGVDPDKILSLATRMFFFGFLGARLFYVIEFWDDQFAHNNLRQTLIAIINFTEGGLVVYGSLIGALLAAWLYLRRQKLPILAISDLIAPSLLLGLAFGRIGCLLNGCCFGSICDTPLAITFPRTSSSVRGAAESPPFQFQLQSGQLHGVRVAADSTGSPVIKHIDPQSPAAAQDLKVGNRLTSINGQSVTSLHDAYGQFYQLGTDVSLETKGGKRAAWSLAEFPQRTRPVHPTQIYSSIHAGLLCLFLLAYYPFRKRDGEVIALCLTIYPVSRFLLEIIRADEKLTQNLTISQLISVMLLGIIIAVWTYVLRQPRKTVLPPA